MEEYGVREMLVELAEAQVDIAGEAFDKAKESFLAGCPGAAMHCLSVARNHIYVSEVLLNGVN